MIGALMVLFFLMARFSDRGVSPAVLAAACAGALLLIFVIVRFGRPPTPSATEGAVTPAAPPGNAQRAKSYPRTLAVLAAVACFEIAQSSAASVAVKVAAGVGAAALLAGAVIYTRRNRR